eukprot:TRINITY_DN7885_c0_g1_i1.p1 TRINITY_DN7885_c0_g1~~TRINITY_DN7885_c0_g1_i1.p1  ORF type:complete len:608 (+),score=124.57 TRINITY_DN7885_c0_g1_i1:99-1922(+)
MPAKHSKCASESALVGIHWREELSACNSNRSDLSRKTVSGPVQTALEINGPEEKEWDERDEVLSQVSNSKQSSAETCDESNAFQAADGASCVALSRSRVFKEIRKLNRTRRPRDTYSSHDNRRLHELLSVARTRLHDVPEQVQDILQQKGSALVLDIESGLSQMRGIVDSSNISETRALYVGHTLDSISGQIESIWQDCTHKIKTHVEQHLEELVSDISAQNNLERSTIVTSLESIPDGVGQIAQVEVGEALRVTHSQTAVMLGELLTQLPVGLSVCRAVADIESHIKNQLPAPDTAQHDTKAAAGWVVRNAVAIVKETEEPSVANKVVADAMLRAKGEKTEAESEGTGSEEASEGDGEAATQAVDPIGSAAAIQTVEKKGLKELLAAMPLPLRPPPGLPPPPGDYDDGRMSAAESDDEAEEAESGAGGARRAEDWLFADGYEALNPGSRGHPELCMKPCLFFAADGGCMNGTQCRFCHLKHRKRPAHLDKKNRAIIMRMPYPERMMILFSALADKIFAIDTGHKLMTLFVTLQETLLGESGLVFQSQKCARNSSRKKLASALHALNLKSLLSLVRRQVPEDTDALATLDLLVEELTEQSAVTSMSI